MATLHYEKTSDGRRVCPECRGDDFVTVQSQGDVVCRQCGLVLESRIIDERSEWRTFSDSDKQGDDPNRVGGPSNTMLADGGLSTSIGRVQGDNGLSFGLQRLQQRQNTSDRSTQNAHRGINQIGDRMALVDSIKTEATRIYQQVADNKSLKGRGLQAIYAGCIFIACRNESMPRSFKEICAVLPEVNRKDIGRAFTAIKNLLQEAAQKEAAELGLDGRTGPSGQERLLAEPASMRRVLSHMGYGPRSKFMAACVKALENATRIGEHEKAPWSGRSPVTILAAVVALMNEVQKIQQAEEVLTLNLIAEKIGAAPTTIQDGYRQMAQFADRIVPPEFADKSVISRLNGSIAPADAKPKAPAVAPPAQQLRSLAAAAAAGPSGPPVVLGSSSSPIVLE